MYQTFKCLRNTGKVGLRIIGTLLPQNSTLENNRNLQSNQIKMHKEVKPQFTVCVEGNIGCGKTTLLNYFSKLKDVSVFHEPVNKWMNLKSYNLLDMMYKDPVRWSHLFQTYVQLTVMEQHIAPCNKHTKIMERSLYSARYCFVENLYQSGKMSDPEYFVYCEWFKMLSDFLDCKVDLIVYLQTRPETVYERIKARDRNEEVNIPLEYLKSLHDLHEEWIFARAAKESVPILVIDANGSLEEMQTLYVKHMKQIVYGPSLSPPPKGIPHSPNKSKKKTEKSPLQMSATAAAN